MLRRRARRPHRCRGSPDLVRDLELAVAELRCGKRAFELMVGTEGEPSDYPIETDTALSGKNLLRDTECIDAERIEAVQVRITVIGARISHDCRMLGLQ